MLTEPFRAVRASGRLLQLFAYAIAATLVLTVASKAHGLPANDVLQPQDLGTMTQPSDFHRHQQVISPDGAFVAYVTSVATATRDGANFDPRGPGRKAL